MACVPTQVPDSPTSGSRRRSQTACLRHTMTVENTTRHRNSAVFSKRALWGRKRALFDTRRPPGDGRELHDVGKTEIDAVCPKPACGKKSRMCPEGGFAAARRPDGPVWGRYTLQAERLDGQGRFRICMFGRNSGWPQVRRFRPKFVRFREKSGRTLSDSGNTGRNLTNSGDPRAISVDWGNVLPNLADADPKVVEFASSPVLPGPSLADIGPKLTDSGRDRPKSGRLRAKIGRVAGFSPMSPKFGPGSTKVEPNSANSDTEVGRRRHMPFPKFRGPRSGTMIEKCRDPDGTYPAKHCGFLRVCFLLPRASGEVLMVKSRPGTSLHQTCIMCMHSDGEFLNIEFPNSGVS